MRNMQKADNKLSDKQYFNLVIPLTQMPMSDLQKKVIAKMAARSISREVLRMLNITDLMIGDILEVNYKIDVDYEGKLTDKIYEKYARSKS